MLRDAVGCLTSLGGLTMMAPISSGEAEHWKAKGVVVYRESSQ